MCHVLTQHSTALTARERYGTRPSGARHEVTANARALSVGVCASRLSRVFVSSAGLSSVEFGCVVSPSLIPFFDRVGIAMQMDEKSGRNLITTPLDGSGPNLRAHLTSINQLLSDIRLRCTGQCPLSNIIVQYFGFGSPMIRPPPASRELCPTHLAKLAATLVLH